VPVANIDSIRAGDVASRVQQALGNPKLTRAGKETDKFNIAWHTRCWQRFKVRPPSKSPNPEQTDTSYCIYDKRHNDYGYTEEWVSFLVKKFGDEKAYEDLFSDAGKSGG
jgi:hypothetical protein